jgi:hypothetical protein
MGDELPALLLSMDSLRVTDIGVKSSKPVTPQRTQTPRAATGGVTKQRLEREKQAKEPQLKQVRDETSVHPFNIEPSTPSKPRGKALLLVMQRGDASVEVKLAMQSLIDSVKLMLTEQLSDWFRFDDEIVIFLENKPLYNNSTTMADGTRTTDLVAGLTSIYSKNYDGSVKEKNIWEQDEPPDGRTALRWVVAVDARWVPHLHEAQALEALEAMNLKKPVPNSTDMRLMRKAWLFSLIYHEITAHVTHSLTPDGMIGKMRALDQGNPLGQPTRVPSRMRGSLRYIGEYPAVNYLMNEEKEHYRYASFLQAMLADTLRIIDSSRELTDRVLTEQSRLILLTMRRYYTPTITGMPLEMILMYTFAMLSFDFRLLEASIKLQEAGSASSLSSTRPGSSTSDGMDLGAKTTD